MRRELVLSPSCGDTVKVKPFLNQREGKINKDIDSGFSRLYSVRNVYLLFKLLSI
jgi:hypothetical protein